MIPGRRPTHPTFRRSFLFALQGLRTAISQERNIKVMLVGGGITIVAGIIVGLDATRWAIIVLCCGAVIASELVNTSIETVVDLVSPEFHPLAGRAKDIAAASELVLCAAVGVVGIIVFATALFF
ncbi:MAG: diacylglycerol kinase family protein [Atopobiaceae bacterium]|jgi:diacylglycerol kinase|nr:diacylglycerol kinase family protein [Olegusella sp.]NLH90880.1 diacylglycerol kinase family protein [Atopobium sp.]